MERVKGQGDTSALVSATTEPVTSQTRPIQDGLALLETHCTRCHTTSRIDQFEKPRTEWKNILVRMESMGVHLSDAEKDVLLDYLAAADQP